MADTQQIPAFELTYESGKGIPCCPEGQGKCPLERRSESLWSCKVVVINGQYKEVRGLNKPKEAYFQCFKREGQSTSFWGYLNDKSKDPMYVDDFQCLAYEEAGIEHPPEETSIQFPLKFRHGNLTLQIFAIIGSIVGMNQLKEELIAKMEQYQKQQKLNIHAKMEEYHKQQKLNIHAKMEEYQKQQQQAIGALPKAQKGNGLTLQNRWDSAARHKGLTLSGPDRLIVEITGKDNWAFHSVFAERPRPTDDFGIFYYEVKIIGKKGPVSAGLGPKQMPLDVWIGRYEGTYAYESCGRFWGHAVEGCRQSSNGRFAIGGKPLFGAGDVIGCGFNLATRQIIYTKNGERLETADLFVDSAAELFPCVTLLHSGTKIEANFGPKFVYKF
ncbi:SPRY domain-containing protein 3 [Globodera pallida]|nr:SPRY domain-containing protein 3 [Globodera pallida]